MFALFVIAFQSAELLSSFDYGVHSQIWASGDFTALEEAYKEAVSVASLG